MNRPNSSFRYILSIILPLVVAGLLMMCEKEDDSGNEAEEKTKSTFINASLQEDQTKKLRVTATAYNSLPGQTEGHAKTTAWGHKLEPGVKAIAVSPDLVKMGLDYKTEVKIEGLPGTYVVLDRMPARWTKRIDIYMGENKQKALDWGRRKVNITWIAEN